MFRAHSRQPVAFAVTVAIVTASVHLVATVVLPAYALVTFDGQLATRVASLPRALWYPALWLFAEGLPSRNDPGLIILVLNSMLWGAAAGMLAWYFRRQRRGTDAPD